MHDRRVGNLQAMAAIWSAKVSDAKEALDQQTVFSTAIRLRRRADFRQAGLCLVTAKEQMEYLTGLSNRTRDEAFATYRSAIERLSLLRADSTAGDVAQGNAETTADAALEVAEQEADIALFHWCLT